MVLTDLDQNQDDVRQYFSNEWISAKKGLINYRRGLMTRIIVTIAGVIFLVLAVMAKDFGAIKAITLVLSIAVLITTIWMLVGLIWYSRVPESTGGSGLAKVALLCSCIGLLFDLYGMYLVMQLYSGSLHRIKELAEQSPYIEALSQVLGLTGMLCLLVSLKKVAASVGAHGVADRVANLITLVVILAVVILIFKIGGARGMGGFALILGLGVLTLAIVALVKFLGVLRDLGNSIGGWDVSRVFE